jgi:hypothetical protein
VASEVDMEIEKWEWVIGNEVERLGGRESQTKWENIGNNYQEYIIYFHLCKFFRSHKLIFCGLANVSDQGLVTCMDPGPLHWALVL